MNLWATDQADDHCEPPVRVVLEEKIELLKERPGRQARDVRELGFALIRRCHSGETGWIRRCYLESVFKEFQKSACTYAYIIVHSIHGCIDSIRRDAHVPAATSTVRSGAHA